jgi:hypothetical protein
MTNWEEQFADQFIGKLLGDTTPIKERGMDDVLTELDKLENDDENL